MQMRYLTTPLLCLLLLAAQSLRAEVDISDPQRLIETRSTQLVNALVENRTAIKSDRGIADKLVAEYVLPHIDFERIARLVLGKHWRTATDEQRKAFTAEFRKLLVNSYTTAMIEFVDDIVSYSKNVRYLPILQSEPDDATVRMEIVLTDRPPVQVNYSLYKNGDNGWQIYDLAVEGASLATTYRGSFSSNIRRSGMDGLIQQLVDKNAENIATHTAASLPATRPATPR